MNIHEHRAFEKRTKSKFEIYSVEDRLHTRYLGENSCKSLTGISTPTAPNRIVMSFL